MNAHVRVRVYEKTVTSINCDTWNKWTDNEAWVREEIALRGISPRTGCSGLKCMDLAECCSLSTTPVRFSEMSSPIEATCKAAVKRTRLRHVDLVHQ